MASDKVSTGRALWVSPQKKKIERKLILGPSRINFRSPRRSPSACAEISLWEKRSVLAPDPLDRDGEGQGRRGLEGQVVMAR